ncbi:MAG: malate dehydrogenase [Methanocalculus sp. MSAO_Arc1]|uniref:malate dehydrogenase n=1 Tax=Methanocalculus TaxID=71151 RepID=UPI000FF6FF75|nr:MULTISPECIES: malate dehydrogenase [unclassified Methanocalculus]MCP1662912.1 malate dehydrogenase [Methanocalculus sp. AMF5]RQD80380.1 MAG: malate dehydrogenase [Methanocalculus sp. MSAO_Arc1]
MVKVTIIGATGQVGSYAAHAISQIAQIKEVCLFGREGNQQYLEGLSRDMRDSFAARGTNTRISWSCDEKDLRGSDIIILTSGVARKADESRLDLAIKNAAVVAEYAEKIGRTASDTLLFVITNPVDVMTAVALRYSHLPPHRVFGLGTHLDSMRLKSCIAEFFNVHVSEVHTRIIGEHGDTMVPLWSATTIGGIQISNLPAFSSLPKEKMMEMVKTSGSLIIKAKGSTVYGPGDAIATIIRTIVEDEHRILTVSTFIRQEVHDIGSVCIGVPARLTRGGAFPVPIKLSDEEVDAFRTSTEQIRTVTKNVFSTLETMNKEKEN